MEHSTSTRGTVVISGGAGYLGSAITSVLEAAGFAVVSIGRSDDPSKVAKNYTEVTAVIHAASAPLLRKPLLEESVEEFASQFDSNITAAFTLFKSFCPFIVIGGAVIGITSKSIEAGAKHQASGSYVPAKYALQGMLRVLSEELKGRAVGVYAVAPAFMPGGLNSDLPKVVSDFIQNKSPKEDVTSPEEVASLILTMVEGKALPFAGKSVTVPGLHAEAL